MKPLRVLILEDNPSDAELMVHELRQAGFEPDWQCVETEVDYLARLEAGLNLILADYSMPGFDAPRALQLLQERDFSIPFIVVTGSISEEVAVECMKQGATDYLLKDRLARLGPAVVRALAQRRLHEDKRRSDQALEQSESQLRLLFESSPIGIAVVRRGMTIFANPAYLRMFGFDDISEIRGVSQLSQVAPQCRDEIVQRSMRRERGLPEPNVYESIGLRKDGSQFALHVEAAEIDLRGERAIIAFFADVTELKKAGEALQKSEERFRDLYDNAPVGYHEYDREGRITRVNRTDLEMLGYTREEMVGQYIWSFNVEEEEAREQILEKLAGSRPHGRNLERTYRRKDGTTLPVLIEDRLILDENGRIRGIRCTIQDISERKRAEEAQRTSETRYRSLFENMLEGFAYCRMLFEGNRPRDFIYLLVNNAFEQLTGLKNVAGKKVSEVIPGIRESDPGLFEVYGRVALTGIPERFETYVDALGMWFSISVYSPKKEYFVAVFDVITERKRAEERLRLQSAALEAAANGIVITDEEGMIEWANPAFTALTGYPFAEVVGKNPRELVKSGEHDQAFYKNLWDTILAGKVWHGQIINRRKDAGLYTEEMTITPLRDERGEIKRFIAIKQDISERKRTEEEKAALEEQLRQSQKMEAIGRLAGGIAHDFNNLLTIIKGYSQLSLLELKEGDPLGGNIEEIKRAADRAADLTRQLLAFSRRQVLEMKVLDLNTVVQGLEKMLRRILGEDIELVSLLAGDLGRVKTDPGQIEQVIMNLGVNARDAMPSGGKLTIETANVDLDREYARAHVAVTPGRYVMLSVSDTGVGMTPEVKERLFEPFFTTKEKGKGTGLGLSTVYGIVKQSGGNIWVYSEPGKGTTFKVYLPRVGEPLEESKEKVETKEYLRGDETILVVEDEEKVRELAVRVLERQGYKVLEAPQGDEALRVCAKHGGSIHLIVTDVVMPGMSGREFAEHLASVRPGIKVLYMSGYTDNAIVHHGVLEPMMDYIQKPFTMDGLARKVREVLDK